MSATYIPVALRRAVIERAKNSCEYCGISDDVMLAPHETDHVVGEQHGGATELDNLAYACFRCNRFKGPNIATRDPHTNAFVPLYNPRTDRWRTHFDLEGAEIIALTPVGGGTASLLRLNDEQRVSLRAELIMQGIFSPPQE